jgi:selenocysteine lyase/cysteine desulfurase
MLHHALDQIMQWGVASIQQYSTELIQPLCNYFKERNFWMEDAGSRADHLFGFLLPGHFNKHSLLQQFHNNNLIVSLRGDAIRISTHIYNTDTDIDKLIEILDKH